MRYLKTYESIKLKEVTLCSFYEDLFVTNKKEKDAIYTSSKERMWMNRYDDVDALEFIKKLFEGKEVFFTCVECVGDGYKNSEIHRVQGVIGKVEFDHSFTPPEVSFVREDVPDIKHVVSATDNIKIVDYQINDLEIKLQHHKDAEKFGI